MHVLDTDYRRVLLSFVSDKAGIKDQEAELVRRKKVEDAKADPLAGGANS